MKTSIVTPIFNNLELCRQTIESVLKKTTGDFEYILIDNHALDNRSREYIKGLNDPHVKVIDPGENIGCHRAVSLGFDNSDGDFLVKLDDDTVILDDGWNEHLIRMMEYVSKTINKCSFIAPDCNVKHGSVQKPYVIGVETFNKVLGGTLGFSCVMIPREIYKEFGPLMTQDWHDKSVIDKSLYGGEELYYCNIAMNKGYCYGYDMGVHVFHLDNENRDLDYVAWKVFYGFFGLTRMSLKELKENKEMLIEAWSKYKTIEPNNQWIQETADKRIKELTE